MAAIASSQPDPYEKLKGNVPGLSNNFLEAIDRSLAVLPKDRLQSAQEWLAMMDGKRDPIAATVANTVREANEATARAARTAPSTPYVPVAPVVVDPAGSQIKKTKAGALLATTAVLALVAGAVVFTRMGGDEVADGTVVPPAVVETQPETVDAAPTAPVEETVVAEVAPVETPAETIEPALVEAEPVETADAEVDVAAAADPVVEADVVDEAIVDVAPVAPAEDAADVAATAEPEAVVDVVPEADVAVVAPDVAVEPEIIADPEPEVVADAAPADGVVDGTVDTPEETAAVVAEGVSDLLPLDTFEVSVIDTGIAGLSADTALAEPETTDDEIIDIFEAAAALASSDTGSDEIAAAINTGRVVSDEPTPIVAPVGAAEGVSDGPFDIDLSTLFPPWAPTLRPAVRPEGLGVEPLVLASNSSIGGQVAVGVTAGAAPGFPEILPALVATPSMPADETAPTAFANADTPFAVPSMESLPLLPVSFQGPQGLPSAELPVFPFAPEVVEEPAPEVVEVLPEQSGPIQVLSSPVLPYNDLFSADVNVTRIYTVNGVAVDSLAQFNSVVRDSSDLGALTEVDVTIETGLVGEGIQQLQTLTLPVMQETQLLNGPSFQSVLTDGSWETRVTAIPGSAQTDLAVGDVVLAYVNTTELLTERTALADLIERESAAGTTEFSFAVLRDGATWVATLTFEDPTAAGQD